jgi:hypothetical protein
MHDPYFMDTSEKQYFSRLRNFWLYKKMTFKLLTLSIIMGLVGISLNACMPHETINRFISPDGNYAAYLVDTEGMAAASSALTSVYISNVSQKEMQSKDLVFQGDDMDGMGITWIGNNRIKIIYNDGSTNIYRNYWVDQNSRKGTVFIELRKLRTVSVIQY